MIAKLSGKWLSLSFKFWIASGVVLVTGAAQHLAHDTGPQANAFSKPESTSRVQAVLSQLSSSAGKKFTLAEYLVPTANAVPHILAIDKEDHIWFSESGGRFAQNFIDVPPVNRIGRLDQAGTVSEWAVGPDGTSPMGLDFDRDGNLWIAERLRNSISCMRKDGSVKTWDIPTPNAWPTGLAVDAQGRVWFTETKGDKVGVVNPADGSLKEYPLPVSKAMMTGIAIDGAGAVWLAERDVDVIGKLDPSTGKIEQYNLPTKNARPCNVMFNAKTGEVWFSERNGGKLGRISPDGAIQEYPLPDRFSGPFIMAADRRGEIWFSNIFSNSIGRFNPKDGSFDFFPVSSPNSHPAGVAVDSKGNVWFAEQSSNKLGVLIRTDLGYLTEETEDAQKFSANAPGHFDIQEFDIPTAQSIPGIVAVDASNVVWFTQMGGGFVGPGFPPGPPGSNVGYVKGGHLHELPMLTAQAGPTSMAKDPSNGDIWVSLRNANKIACIRDFAVKEYDIPVPNSLVVGITVDQGHNVWVALSDASKIGRRTPAGDWKFLDIPDPEAQPRTVHVTRDNEVWFAEKVGNHIGWVDQKNWKLQRWEIPTRLAWPLSLEEDADGNIWFAEMRADKIAKFDRHTQKISEYRIPLQSAPFKLLYDKENSAFWISTVFASSIMRFDIATKKIVANYRVPNEGAWVGGLDRDRDSCIWFSEQFANKIGRLCVAGVAKTMPASSAANAGAPVAPGR